MAKQVQWRRGSTDAHATFVGANGEITIDTNKKTLVVHDGVKAGGFPTVSEFSFIASNEDINEKIDNVDTKHDDALLDFKNENNDALNSVNLFRSDKYLASQNVANMVYNSENKLEKVQYRNPSDVDYELLTYNLDGKLIDVAHYVGSILKGNTQLSYVNGKLVSAPYVAV